MEDRATPRMRKYGESKTTRIMMATVPHVTSGSGLRIFQADGLLLDRVYHETLPVRCFYIDTTNCAGVSSFILSRPSPSFNQHNTGMVVNDVIFSISLLLVLPKVNPNFSIYMYFFLWGKGSSFKRPIAMEPEDTGPSIS